MRSIKRLMPASMLLCAMLILNACATTTGSDAIKAVQGADTYCQIALPIGTNNAARNVQRSARPSRSHSANARNASAIDNV